MRNSFSSPRKAIKMNEIEKKTTEQKEIPTNE